MSLIASRAALFGKGVVNRHVKIAAAGGYCYLGNPVGIGGTGLIGEAKGGGCTLSIDGSRLCTPIAWIRLAGPVGVHGKVVAGPGNYQHAQAIVSPLAIRSFQVPTIEGGAGGRVIR